jgi:N-carbamoyl-L-amino-acid hydrolase
MRVLDENRVDTRRPLMMVAFTNEEGARFTTDMMGSRAFRGELSVSDAWDVRDFDGVRVGDELKRIDYAGDFPCGKIKPSAYLELHIEQGPLLDREQITIGAVEAITGISWQELCIRGAANHAGTTPMDSRRDAGLAAAKIIQFLRELANSLPDQRATCGRLSFSPGVINVIPGEAIMTVDLRNGEDELLREAEDRLSDYLKGIAGEEKVEITSRMLARVSPSRCDPSIVAEIEASAKELGYSHRRMVSGAGHDAQIMAHICPTAMIFIPSKDGISHSPAEYSRPEDIEAGANVLLQTALRLAGL